MIIGVIIHFNHVLTDVGPLCARLKARGHTVRLFANAGDVKEVYHSPYRHQEHLRNVEYHTITWYHTYSELADLLKKSDVSAVFAEEDMPFLLEPAVFQNRSYKIYNIVHSVDNFHRKGVAAGVLNLSFVGFEKYGEYLGWNKNEYIALGLPKYDIISSLDVADIRKKYTLPKKYILLLTPNNDLFSTRMLYRVIREIRRQGYAVVMKGKAPKCHKPWYRFMGEKYFLSDVSFYPFITHELIRASAGVVGFDTTAVEEILMCERPLVNFSIKPYRDKSAREGNFKQFVPMWASPFCLDLDIMDWRTWKWNRPLPEFMGHFRETFDYKKIQAEFFSVPGGASDRIIDFLEKTGT